jgi:hypothetical protein
VYGKVRQMDGVPVAVFYCGDVSGDRFRWENSDLLSLSTSRWVWREEAAGEFGFGGRAVLGRST